MEQLGVTTDQAQDETESGERRWMSLRPRNIAMSTRVATTVVGVSVLALLVTTIVGIATGRSLNRELDREQLNALQASAAQDVAARVGFLLNNASALARSPETAAALESFDAAHRELLTAQPSSENLRNLLATEYRQRYVELLQSVWPDIQVRDVLPENRAALHLQAQYSLQGDQPVDPDTIDDAGDGSRWSEVHAARHPGYRDYVDRLGVLDLFLVEPDGRHIVYSVRKRADLGTSLQIGPFSGSGLASAVEQARRAGDSTAVITDLGLYPPALTSPVGFVASPVRSGPELVGFVVLMYDREPFEALLTADRNWDGGGYPPTGETLLFGGDGKVRTEVRSFVEDPAGHVAAAAELGMSERDQEMVEALDTTVLTQSVATTTLAAAVEGDTTLTERANLLGVPALSVAGPVPVDGLDWYVLAEVGVDAAENRVEDFARLLVVGVAITVIAVAFGAVDWARNLVRPVRDLSDQLGRAAIGRVRVEVPPNSPVEFRDLARSFESMTDRIDEQRRLVADTRRERLALLHRMLPPAVAARIEAGERQAVEEIAQATVAVLVVLGLGELVRAEPPEAGRDHLNRILIEVDELAARHQVDRIKIVGDAYFASCGHDRPFIDHAPRMLRFVVDAGDAIRALSGGSASQLAPVAGIHSGPITVGMTGPLGAVYDVWGETVSTAHYLARAGGAGEILVTQATRDLLPEDVEAVPVAGDAGEIWRVSIESMRSTT